MNLEKVNKVNKYLLVLYFILQPILELILSVFKDNVLSIGGISIATLVRYGMLAVMIAIAVVCNFKRKSTKVFLGSLILYAVFFVLHYVNIRNFGMIILGESMQKGIVTAAMYISKFIIPICIVYLVYILRFKYNDFKVSVLSVATFVSLVMIITNLCGIDYVAYSFEENPPLAANIVKWFDKSFEYTEWRLLTSRGLYPSANELSALFILLLPCVVWIALKEKKNFYFVLVILQMISMLLVGTRISVYGEIAVVVGVFVIWLLDKIINKQHIEKRKIFCLAIILAVFGVFFAHSPFYNRIKVGEGGKNSFEIVEPEPEEEIELTEDDNTADRIFVKLNYAKEAIPEETVTKMYSYLEHTDFWVHIIKDVNILERDNARKLKTLILDDIENEKNAKLDSLVGIGEIPIYPERDYVAQYYYIGVIGIVLFLLPFIVLFVVSGFYNLIRLFGKRFDGIQGVCLLCLAAIFGTGYLAGHALEPIYINSFIGLIAGMLIIFLFTRSSDKISENGMEKYIAKVYKDGKESFVSELEDRMKNDKKTFVVTANPETLMIGASENEFNKCLLDDNTIIVPDGIGVIKGANLLAYDVKETITGVELCKDIFRIANNEKKSIFLFGAKREVVEELKNVLNRDYPDMNVVGIEDGYVDDKQEVFDRIKELKPDVVLVALGIPSQELLIYDNLNDFDKGVFMGVGGSFDVLSGLKKRAPEFFVKFHLEWLYRITVEPKRLKRFFNSNIRYVFKILQER